MIAVAAPAVMIPIACLCGWICVASTGAALVLLHHLLTRRRTGLPPASRPEIRKADRRNRADLRYVPLRDDEERP